MFSQASVCPLVRGEWGEWRCTAETEGLDQRCVNQKHTAATEQRCLLAANAAVGTHPTGMHPVTLTDLIDKLAKFVNSPYDLLNICNNSKQFTLSVLWKRPAITNINTVEVILA